MPLNSVILHVRFLKFISKLSEDAADAKFMCFRTRYHFKPLVST